MAEEPRKINWWVPAGVVGAVVVAYLVPVVKLWLSNAPPPPVPRQLTTVTGLNVHPSFSPDGKEIVYASNRNGNFELFVKQVAGGAERVLTTGGTVEPAWSPDGGTIVYRVEQGGLFVIPAAGGAARKIAAGGSQPAWWPDASRLVFTHQARLWVVALPNGNPEPLTKAGQPEGEHVAPRFSPDKKHLGFLCAKRLWEIDVESKQLTQVTEGDPSPTSFVYGGDGLTVYFFASAGKKAQGLYQLNRDSATRKPKAAPIALSEGEGAMLQDLEIDSSGKRLAYSMVTGEKDKQLGNTYIADLQVR